MSQSELSPFAQLSYSEQQEQWRVFRARHLDFQQVEPEPPASPAAPRMPSIPRDAAPRHANLDRVRAQLAAASRRAGAFQNVTSRE